MLTLDNRAYDACLAWGQRMLEIIEQQKPDLVILGQRGDLQPYFREGEAQVPTTATLVQLWRRLETLGVKVVVIADTPYWGVKAEECLAKDPHCSVSYKSIVSPDPLVLAHDLYPHVSLIDFNDVVCPNQGCPAVIGNVVVWRDLNHVSATYSRSMADIFGKRLDAAIAASGAGNLAVEGSSTSLR